MERFKTMVRRENYRVLTIDAGKVLRLAHQSLHFETTKGEKYFYFEKELIDCLLKHESHFQVNPQRA